MNYLPTVLVAEADGTQMEKISMALEKENLEVFITRNTHAALDRIKHAKIDILIVSLRIDRIDGLKLLEAVQLRNSDVDVIFVTGPNVVETELGVKAMLSHDSSYFLPKPINPVHLRAFLRKAMESQRLKIENRKLQSQIDEKVGLVQLTGNSTKMEGIRRLCSQVAPTRATVMIRGERGTGKELVARAIHHRSLRKGQLVIFNCAAISESLAESELFGHERGAFTGAHSRRKGRFELANGGTLFLDEIGKLSLSNQAKLLRLLENREFERVGGSQTIKVDVRILCATNRDLEKAVDKEEFLPDLYDRLNVIRIDLPDLSDRKEDIPLLVKTFIDEFCRENRKETRTVTSSFLNSLRRYDWPGNVRELRNTIEGMIVLSNKAELDLVDLPPRISEFDRDNLETISPRFISTDRIPPEEDLKIEVGMSLAEVEKKIIDATLESFDRNRTKSATVLEISRQTILRKIKEYGLC